MGWLEQAHWESSVDGGVPRSERRSGAYQRYVPDLVDGTALAVDGDVSRRVAGVERSVRELNGPGAEGLAGIARFLLRSRRSPAPGSRASHRRPSRSRSPSWACPRRSGGSASTPGWWPTT